MKPTSHSLTQYPAPTIGAPFSRQKPVPPGPKAGLPDLMVSKGMVLVQVDPQNLVGQGEETLRQAKQRQAPQLQAQVQQRAKWAFRCATPQERAYILQAIEEDLNSDVNYDALLAALRLSKAQATALLSDYKARPLRGLMLESPPFQSSTTDVAQALWGEVLNHRDYLSTDDEQALALFAAVEMLRRCTDWFDEKDVHQCREALLQDLRRGLAVETAALWRNRSTGPIESHIAGQLGQGRWTLAREALLPLLSAQVRKLETCLGQVPGVAEGPLEERGRLADLIKQTFKQLLSQSFALGAEGPQDLYEALQHLVCNALDRLGFKNAFVMEIAGTEPLRSICSSVGQSAPDADRLSPEQTAMLRQHFRDDSLRRLICGKSPNPWTITTVERALIKAVHEYRDYLSPDDLGSLVDSAAAAIVRRDPSTDQHQVAMCLAREVMITVYGSLDPPTVHWWGNGARTPGRIENEATNRLRFGTKLLSHALPPLLIAQARVLDRVLANCSHAAQQQLSFLAWDIQEIFERLLSQSFALGSNGPQDLYSTVAQVVRSALDGLQCHHLPVVKTPTQERLQKIGFLPEAPNLSQGGDDRQIADPVPLAPSVRYIDTPVHPILPASKKRSADQMGAGTQPLRPSLVPPSLEQTRIQARADAVQAVAKARKQLDTSWRQPQQGLLCLKHSYDNGWYQFLRLRGRQDNFVPLLLSAKEAQTARGLEPVRIGKYAAPDGHVMKIVRWTPAQFNALMPVLEQHLDLAVVLKAKTQVNYGDEVHMGHFTSLIQVKNEDGRSVHFEIDSLPAKGDERGFQWVELPDFFNKRCSDGVLMAIRGNPDHPLSKYLELLSIERFRRLCEAFGFVLGKQPIMEFADHYAQSKFLDEEAAVEFLAKQGLRNVRSQIHEGYGDQDWSQAIVDWLNDLGTTEAILFTGVSPMVMSVTLQDGDWVASVIDEGGEVRRRLIEVLRQQQKDVLAMGEGAHVEALTWEPLVVPQALPALPVRIVASPQLPVMSPVQAEAPSLEEAKSQKILLDVLKAHPYTDTYHPELKKLMDTALERNDFDGTINHLRKKVPYQSLMFFNMAKAIQHSNKPASEHLVTLFLLCGGYKSEIAETLLSLLPDGIPACFVRYEEDIAAKVRRWRDVELRAQVIGRLGL